MASVNKRTVWWTTGHDEQRTAVCYEATYHDRNGKRHRRMFDLKRDAQRWLDEQAAGLVTGSGPTRERARRRSRRTPSGGAPRRRMARPCATRWPAR